MKQVFRLGLPLCLLFGACFTPSKNCKRFKTGTFEYEAFADGEFIQAKIVRNDTMEIDYFDEKKPDTSDIRWINECEYILKKHNPRTDSEKQRFQMKIIETEKNQYTFVFSQVGESKIKEFTARRTKDTLSD